MIRNILLMKNGLPLFNEYFGNCHDISRDDVMVSGFIDAISSFTQQFFGSAEEQIRLDNYTILIQRNTDGLVTVFICDNEDDIESAKIKIERVTKLFSQRYRGLVDSFSGGKPHEFKSFRNMLLEMKIAEKNCGGRPECEGCPNSKTRKPFLEKLSGFERILLSRGE